MTAYLPLSTETCFPPTLSPFRAVSTRLLASDISSFCCYLNLGVMCAKSLQSCLTLCDPVDCSLPGSSVQGFSRREHWSGWAFPSPGDLPDPEIEPKSLMSPALASGLFTTGAIWEALFGSGICVYSTRDWGFGSIRVSCAGVCLPGVPRMQLWQSPQQPPWGSPCSLASAHSHSASWAPVAAGSRAPVQCRPLGRQQV